jgi:hypothetical protein
MDVLSSIACQKIVFVDFWLENSYNEEKGSLF